MGPQGRGAGGEGHDVRMHSHGAGHTVGAQDPLVGGYTWLGKSLRQPLSQTEPANLKTSLETESCPELGSDAARPARRLPAARGPLHRGQGPPAVELRMVYTL